MEFKKIFCRHKWRKESKPYTENGLTRVNIICNKCGKKVINKPVIKVKRWANVTQCFCPQCGNELVYSYSFVKDTDYVYFKCSFCGHKSKWDFDTPCPILIEEV